MTRMKTSEVRNNLSEIINRAAYGKERIILTRRGKDLAIVAPIEDLKLLEKLEEAIDIADAEKALKNYKKRGGTKFSKLVKELGL